MKALDIYLQKKRIKIVSKQIESNSSILDIGCSNGELFEHLGKKLEFGIGIDPLIGKPVIRNNYELHPGIFPNEIANKYKFDAITIIAVIEHLPTSALINIENDCSNLLNNNGIVIITVPSPIVDIILDFLRLVRLIDGMSLEEHHGYKPSDTLKYFSKKFTLIKKNKFQLGLNNLYIFKKL